MRGRLGVLLTACALIIGVTAAPASAHTTLQSASPRQDSRVASPAEIVLTYADTVMIPRVVLFDDAGRHYEAGRAHSVDNTVTLKVAGPLAPGLYRVGWRVVAPDGHPVSGEYSFTVNGSPGSGPVSAGSQSRVQVARPSGASWWWIGLGGLGLAAVAGAVAFLRRRPRT
ncbi:MAG TPA: copper resistance protein CopC [Streptosporangiaceae bacterium]|nr:copper resistance protein CopC [Streptosporangiaceae bacterium]